jgi:hypothetical protein
MNNNELIVLPSSGQLVEQSVKDAKELILSGQLDWREVLRRKQMLSKSLEELFKDKEIKEHLESEYAKEGRKKVEYEGIEIGFVSKKNYSYDKCGSPDWEKAKAAFDKAKEELDRIQKELQVMTKPRTEVNEESGEVFTIYPAAYTNTDYFTISIKK